MTNQTKLVIDQIQTDNIEYAKVLDQAQREGFPIPHNGYMWRVTGQDSENFSRMKYIGPLVNTTPRPILIHGPTVWMFTLERDSE